VVDEKMLLLQDSEGITLLDAMQEIEKLSFYPKQTHDMEHKERVTWCIQNSRRYAEDIKAYVELHVEQGQDLEEYGIPVGVVTGAATPTRVLIDLLGQQNHSGTTPMHKRKNALCAASEVILAVDDLCHQEAENETVGAITKLIVEPNSVNVIPGRCTITLDLRSTSQESKQRVVKLLRQEIDTICIKRGVVAIVKVLVDETPIGFSQSIIGAVEKSCKILEIPYRLMPSRAGHDACHMTRLIKEVGMIFVPSKDGISHSPLEWTDAQDIHYGAKVLLCTLLQLAME
jgi:hydantoinase/carbamoylase family amidase